MSTEPTTGLDWKTISAVGGWGVGIVGLLYGLLRDRLTRRDSRLDALSQILHPLVRASQDLMKANGCRKTTETLKHSFPESAPQQIVGVDAEAAFPSRTPEVTHRINEQMRQYNELITSSEGHFRDAEAQFAARSFRFPSGIADQLEELRNTVGELGRLVNSGHFDKADVQLAVFGVKYKEVADTARGWRLADPFEGLLRHFRTDPQDEAESDFEFELSKKEMDYIIELVEKRVTSQRGKTFAVHPPSKLLTNMALLESDLVVDELKDSVFSIVFQDGTGKMLSLPELLAFIYNIILFETQKAELERMVHAADPDGPRQYNVSLKFAMQEIMEPSIAKVLLSKVKFSSTPSDK